MPVSHRRAPRVARDTIVYTNAPIRRGEALIAHLCTLLPPRGAARSPTVYTNAPNRRGEARSSHLCTLLRSQGHPQPKPAAQQCTQTPQSGAESPDPPICVHFCGPLLPKKADRYLGRTCLQARGPGRRRGAEPDGDNQRGGRHGRRDIGKQLQCPRAWQTCAGVFGLLCPFREMTKAVDLRMYAGPAFCGINFLNAPGFEWGA